MRASVSVPDARVARSCDHVSMRVAVLFLLVPLVSTACAIESAGLAVDDAGVGLDARRFFGSAMDAPIPDGGPAGVDSGPTDIPDSAAPDVGAPDAGLPDAGPPPSTCGDGACGPDETAASCPIDCCGPCTTCGADGCCAQSCSECSPPICSGCHCHYECTGGMCTFHARPAGSSETVTCRAGSSCHIHCESGARCDVLCEAGATCSVDCEDDSRCDVTCDGSCTYPRCEAFTWETCPDGRRVCGVAC